MSHYGLQVGDQVRFRLALSWHDATVIHCYALDANRVRLRLADGYERDMTAEWCRRLAPPTPSIEEAMREHPELTLVNRARWMKWVNDPKGGWWEVFEATEVICESDDLEQALKVLKGEN